MAGTAASSVIRTRQNPILQGNSLYAAGGPAENVLQAEIERLASEKRNNAQKQKEEQKLRNERNMQHKKIETLSRRIKLQEQKDRRAAAARAGKKW